MKLAKIAVLLLAFVALSALAAEDPRHEKARKTCNAEGEAAGNKAVAEAKVQHPADVVRVKQQAKVSKIHVCMRLAGYASGPVRAK